MQYFKFVVHLVEKYVKRSKRDTRLVAMYVIDAILRNSRSTCSCRPHICNQLLPLSVRCSSFDYALCGVSLCAAKFGDKDQYSSRFAVNLNTTFEKIVDCSDEDRVKSCSYSCNGLQASDCDLWACGLGFVVQNSIKRVLGIWEQKEYFDKPQLDRLSAILADPAFGGGKDEDEELEKEKQAAAKEKQHSGSRRSSKAQADAQADTPNADEVDDDAARKGSPIHDSPSGPALSPFFSFFFFVYVCAVLLLCCGKPTYN